MPNWCSNELTITGEPKQITKFKKKAKSKATKQNSETELSLNKFYPVPKPLLETTSGWLGSGEAQAENEAKKKRNVKNYGYEDWYSWSVENWGTKWDVDASLAIEDDDCLVYDFDSAWSPPVAWLQKVSGDYPELSFRLKYEEEGVGFMGLAKATAGEVDDQVIEY